MVDSWINSTKRQCDNVTTVTDCAAVFTGPVHMKFRAAIVSLKIRCTPCPYTLNCAHPALRDLFRPAIQMSSLSLSLSQLDDGRSFQVKSRFDTDVELEYYKHGGILNYMIRKMAQ